MKIFWNFQMEYLALFIFQFLKINKYTVSPNPTIFKSNFNYLASQIIIKLTFAEIIFHE